MLAAIAVIAAMVTVPGAKAQDADGEAIQIQPDDSFGSDTEKLAGVAKGWGTMVWAGAPVKDPNKEWTTDFGKAGNPGSNAGWAWCVDISKAEPMRNTAKYDVATAGKAPIPENLRDAAINVATLSKQALKKGEEGRQTVATYSYYLSALIGDNSSSKIARHGIVDPGAMKNDQFVGPVFKDFKGSLKEFESLTGFTINPNEPWELQKLDSVSVPKAPEGAFITLVGPNGRLTGPTKPGEKIGKNANDQRVMPPDQPGLPDNPDNGGGSEEPTTSDENTTEETTSENPEEETSSSETTTDSEPTDSEETTTEDTEEPTPGKTTDVVPNPDPTPTTEEQEKDLNPEIKTEASFDGEKQQVVAGATVKDKVHYEDLVPGKKYTLKAELRNKAVNEKGENEVVGKGEVTFTPKKSAGEEVVDIKVNDDVVGVIKAAVAFEDLYSKQVDENGKETPNSDEEKKIADHRDINDEAQTVTSKMEPSIGTKAEKARGDEIKAGTVISDTVEYTDLVPGKEYTLNAELRSKVKDEATGDYPVIGHGKKTFVAKTSKGTEEVKITVDEGVTEAVDEAVAFEYLTSTAVNKDGKDSTTGEKNDIAEHTDIEDKEQTVKSDKPSESTTPETATSTEDVPGTPGDGGESETSKPSEPSSSEETASSEQSSTEDSSTPKTSETCESEEPSDSESEKPSEEPSESESSEPSESVETTTSQASETSTSEEPSDCESTTPNEPSEPGEPSDGDEGKTPKISTNADFEDGSHEVIAGAKIVDEVSYEGLVPGKEYTLKAELINKKDGKSVLGEGEETFTPKESKGSVDVHITVNDDVTEPVEAAVAFEELTSTEVNDKGEDTPGTTPEKPNHIAEHKDINDKDQTVTSHEVQDQDTPGGSSNGSSKGKTPWWLILIPGIGLGKIIKDHHDHKDHGNHDGGNGDNTGNHDGGNGHEDKDQDAPQGGNSDNGHGHGRDAGRQGQQPEETGNALPSNADRVEIKSVPSGATELEPGMQDYIK
ncbi:VaFE repeat-containing surface-anchored protein [Corynebacterium curieae]|nr:VaFE repeat-containing surface-anchored protein [Corynebacterium curieae]